MNYDEMIDYLYGLKEFKVNYSLNNMKKALEAFDNPQDDLKVIHITGTNGKGSVAAMVSSILTQAGHSNGLYTSPHLVDFSERICVDGKKIGANDLLALFERIMEKELELSYFEFLTMLALLHFKDKNTEYVILEVGLGGTLDATNIAQSIISVVTNVSLDHVDILGKTVEAIAKDKCGIIKQNSIVVTSAENPSVIEIVESVSEEKNCRLIHSESWDGKVGLLGNFQKVNAGVAADVARALKVSEEDITSGLKQVRWPGRVHWVDDKLLLDCAHNPVGVKALAEYVNGLTYDKLYLVFGCCFNRDYKAMLAELPAPDTLIFTRADILKAQDPSAVSIDCVKVNNCGEAVEKARALCGKNDLVLVTGSIYMIGDVMQKCGFQ